MTKKLVTCDSFSLVDGEGYVPSGNLVEINLGGNTFLVPEYIEEPDLKGDFWVEITTDKAVTPPNHEVFIDGAWVPNGLIQANTPTSVRNISSPQNYIGGTADPAVEPSASTTVITSWSDSMEQLSFLGKGLLTSVPASLPAALTNMQNMFQGATAFNQDISGWDTSAVTNSGSMFQNATAFNQAIGGWDTSQVTNMNSMFQGASAFNGDISGWDTSQVTTMVGMFRNAASFHRHLTGWDTSSVTLMGSMFRGTTAFNGDISGWDTSSVTAMHAMFANATAFNGAIAGWDTSSVTVMDSMFNGASAFNRNLSGWCVAQIPTPPESFGVGASAWVQPKPNWGEPC